MSGQGTFIAVPGWREHMVEFLAGRARFRRMSDGYEFDVFAAHLYLDHALPLIVCGVTITAEDIQRVVGIHLETEDGIDLMTESFLAINPPNDAPFDAAFQVMVGDFINVTREALGLPRDERLPRVRRGGQG